MYDSGGVYTSPDGKCFNGIIGTYYGSRGGPQLSRGTIVSLRPDDTVLPSVAFDIGSKRHHFFLRRAVGGEPAMMHSKHRFDVPLVDARDNDPPEVVAIRKALERGLVVEFAVRRDHARLRRNEWFRPEANIRGPVAALLVDGYSAHRRCDPAQSAGLQSEAQ